jgi:Fe-S-cluster containining protein
VPLDLDTVLPDILAEGDTDHASCDACDAVCCRLTVVVQPEDGIPGHLLEQRDGLTVMARDEEGWCVALDSAHMCCSIYESRPTVCRRFVMDGPYCHSVRADYSARRAIGIELIAY